MLILWNETDNVPAAPKMFTTRHAALEYARAWRMRYAGQGYYLTAKGERIPPSAVELTVLDVPD